MKVAKLDNMKRGWFVGDFEPTCYATQDTEVAVKHFKAGEVEDWHLHKIATELTVIISGEVEMNGRRFGANDIITVEAGEGADFKALTDTVLIAVKLPGAKNDKYLRADLGEDA